MGASIEFVGVVVQISVLKWSGNYVYPKMLVVQYLYLS